MSDIKDVFNLFNFLYNKTTGAWYPISDIENAIDAGQMSLYADYQPRYATSQRIKDALAPFKGTYNFTTQLSGYVIVPDTTYLDLLDIQIYYQLSNRTIYFPITLANEDTRAMALNSQVDPVTITNPIGEQMSQRSFKLYPAGKYNGTVSYLRRPVKPVFGYTLISGRVIVYNPSTSTQLEWADNLTNQIIAKALASVGINMSSAEIEQYAAAKTADNYQGVNHL